MLSSAKMQRCAELMTLTSSASRPGLVEIMKHVKEEWKMQSGEALLAM